VSHIKLQYPLSIMMIVAAVPLYAQQPAAPAAAAPAASAPAATTPAANPAPAAAQTSASTKAAQPSPETVKKARELGLRPEVHKGVTMYCWQDSNIGSRFPTKKCADADQLDDIIAQREAAKDDMRRSMTGTSSR